jgi:PAS domain S-box-containing protein
MNHSAPLSDREAQLLELAAEGLTDAAIAKRLGIRETTVSTYWARIRAKVGTVSRTELVAKALRRRYQQMVLALREENRRLVEGVDSQSKSDAIYRMLIEEAADAILIVSSTGEIEMLNESAAGMFGWSSDELVGKHISVLLPERFQESHSTHVERYVSAPAKRTMGDHMSTPAQHKDGSEFPVFASLSGITTEIGTAVICILRTPRLQ